MKKMIDYAKDNKKKVLFLVLWSMVIFWITKDQITNAIQPGKIFSGRSILIQVFIFLGFSFVYYCFLSTLGFIFKRLISDIKPFKLSTLLREISFKEKIKIAFHPAMQLTFMLWIVIFSYIHRGFDITDNGYYLLIAHRYDDVAFELKQFGLITRLIFLGVGESVALMRVAGGAILFFTSILCGWSIGKLYNAKSSEQWALFLVLPTIPAGMYYREWLSTPSYNWLALLSGELLIIGLNIFLSSTKRGFFLGGVLFGISGQLAILAKPTTAIFFTVLVILFIVSSFKEKRKFFLIIFGCISSIFLGIFLLAYTKLSLGDLIIKCLRGYEISKLLGHSTDELIQPIIIYLKWVFTQQWIICFFSLTILFFLKKFSSFFYFPNKIVDRILLLFWIVFLFFSIFIYNFNFDYNIGYWVSINYIVTFFFVVASTNLSWKNLLFNKFTLCSLSVLVIAFGIAFGTNNQYFWVFSNIACIFICSISYLLLNLRQELLSIALKSLTLILLFIVPYHMFFAPINNNQTRAYRQDSDVWLMEKITPIRLGKESVVLGINYDEAFTKIQKDAITNGFIEGTPVIDLTGNAPGIVYILDGRSPVYPWMIGGDPNSVNSIRNILLDWKVEDLKKAWILTSENYYRSLPISLLHERGLDFPYKYKKISTILISGVDEHTIELWMPCQ